VTAVSRDFRLIGVSGACSRAGKTALAVTLLRALAPGPRLAVKFTTTDDVFERCPRGTSCVVCDIDVPFRIVTDPAVLAEPGTDTARLFEAGASRVLWVIARRGAVREAWRVACTLLEGWRGDIVMEGSTITDVARPDMSLFVAHPFLDPSRWKAGSEPLIRAADRVVENSARMCGRRCCGPVVSAAWCRPTSPHPCPNGTPTWRAGWAPGSRPHHRRAPPPSPDLHSPREPDTR
jgi:hypothetical protein